jgi:signal transduction histidine kinase
MRQSPWLRLAALGTWAVCGLPAMATILRGEAPPRVAIAWAIAFAAYGAALVIGLWRRASAPRLATACVALQSAAAIVLTYTGSEQLAPTGVGLLVSIGLMVVVAAELPHLVAAPIASAWIAAQTVAMTMTAARGGGPADALAFGLGAIGFQMFAAMTTALMLREAAARLELARVNAELHAARALLAEHSRAGERLRIARDLHDTLGHHLTALSLQLDVGSRLATGRAAEHVSQAHAIARLLLAEVRTVVGEMRERGHADLGQAIRTLAAGAGPIAVHVRVADRLTVDDAAQAQSLLRCVQEIITNARRHADARNLWITIERTGAGLGLHARDDGRGAATVRDGNGLTGMRERFAEYAGSIEFSAGPSGGFEVRGFMPIARDVA